MSAQGSVAITAAAALTAATVYAYRRELLDPNTITIGRDTETPIFWETVAATNFNPETTGDES